DRELHMICAGLKVVPEGGVDLVGSENACRFPERGSAISHVSASTDRTPVIAAVTKITNPRTHLVVFTRNCTPFQVSVMGATIFSIVTRRWSKSVCRREDSSM